MMSSQIGDEGGDGGWYQDVRRFLIYYLLRMECLIGIKAAEARRGSPPTR